MWAVWLAIVVVSAAAGWWIGDVIKAKRDERFEKDKADRERRLTTTTERKARVQVEEIPGLADIVLVRVFAWMETTRGGVLKAGDESEIGRGYRLRDEVVGNVAELEAMVQAKAFIDADGYRKVAGKTRVIFMTKGGKLGVQIEEFKTHTYYEDYVRRYWEAGDWISVEEYEPTAEKLNAHLKTVVEKVEGRILDKHP